MTLLFYCEISCKGGMSFLILINSFQFNTSKRLYGNITIYYTIKDPHWYIVQEGDATMLLLASSLPGHQNTRSLS